MLVHVFLQDGLQGGDMLRYFEPGKYNVEMKSESVTGLPFSKAVTTRVFIMEPHQ